ncbi:MAG: phospholipase [Muribaculaceae bacterium]|nr:phospholipase [Muribaculaceae bacterium]
MEPALILLGLLAIVGAVLWLVDGRRKPSATDAEATEPPAEQGCTDTSCALHSVCPSEQLLTAACSDKVTYYEDEELDTYSGRGEDDYSEEEIEQFREVLYTLRPSEVLAWHHSLQRRGVVLPAALRDELLMMASER